ncbi:hypothetical protein GE061_006706 [Apolygus lucorum]|uniref:DDE-1 domain-containing protein n=1 Tax=Apolygus lucorum TaxID=248454 RepID=A0A6A4JA88_APOLU|nr:hypothetical protein GE061_006706 [Apolygus lucorum]
MVSATFFEYVSKVLLTWLKERGTTFPVILFVDGHKSHLSMELSKFCAENEIIVYCLPPNATHIVQPCDVGIFRPLKAAWKNVVRISKQSNIVTTKLNFAGLFKRAFDSVKVNVIQKSFEACGLYPLNEDVVDYSKCISVRRAEIIYQRDESVNSDEYQPTFSDYAATRRLIEFTIGREKLESFHENLRNGANEDCGDLFGLWKTSYTKTAGDGKTSEDPDKLDIMNIPMIVVENSDSILTLNNHADEIALPDPQRNNIDDVLHELDFTDLDMTDGIFCTSLATSNEPNQRSEESGDLGQEDVPFSKESDESLQVNRVTPPANENLHPTSPVRPIPTNSPAANNSSQTDCNKLSEAWAKTLTIPQTASQKPQENKLKPKIPFCITLAEWRSIQEDKERDKEEKEKVKIEKQKAREEKKKERELKQLEKRKKGPAPKNQRSRKKMTQPSTSSAAEFICPGCDERYEEPPVTDWVQCCQCELWWHDKCTDYTGNGPFKCDN